MTAEELATLVRRPARAAGFGGATAALLAAYELHRRAASPARQAELLARYRHAWLGTVLRMFGVELVAEPDRPAPAQGARLVVANHRSALDIAVLLWLFGGRMVSRADLSRWPLLGAVARAGGTIFVERGEGMSRAAAARAIRRRLLEGDTVTVFPEGTTFAGDEVRAFHSGAFAAARGLPVEIVPVGLAYEPGAEFQERSFLEHLGRTAGRARTRVVARLGAPLRAGDDEDARAVAARCRASVQDLVAGARAALDARR